MGLDINGKTKHYSASYSGLHLIRYIAYKYCTGEKDYSGFMGMQKGTLHVSDFEYGAQGLYGKTTDIVQLKEAHYDEAFMMALDSFRNLLWHSDCEGNYTLKGKTPILGDPKNNNLLTGNSVQLLKEVEILKQKKKKIPYDNEKAWELLNTFYDVVEDCIKNNKGRVEFH